MISEGRNQALTRTFHALAKNSIPALGIESCKQNWVIFWQIT
jgi:hypothetical protein